MITVKLNIFLFHLKKNLNNTTSLTSFCQLQYHYEHLIIKTSEYTESEYMYYHCSGGAFIPMSSSVRNPLDC